MTFQGLLNGQNFKGLLIRWLVVAFRPFACLKDGRGEMREKNEGFVT